MFSSRVVRSPRWRRPISAVAFIPAGGSPKAESLLISKIAREICKTIRDQPRWEEHLLKSLSSRYPSSLFFHPACLREVLRRQSLDPLLSLRYTLWVCSSSSSAADPAASAAVFDALVAAGAGGAAMTAICSTKCRPSDRSLSLFLRRLLTAGAFQEALQAVIFLGSVFNFTPPLPVWNAAMEGSLKLGDPHLAFNFYHRMVNSGVPGDALSLGLLARALCEAGRLDEAHCLLRGAARAGLAATPGVAAFSELVSKLARQRRYSEMSAVLHLMIAAGRPPDLFTYQAIIHALFRGGLVAEARRIFAELRRRGYSPDVPTFTAMIDGLCKMGSTEEALSLFEEMALVGLKPNEYTFNVLVDHFWKKGDWELAQRLHQEMLNSGFAGNSVTLNTRLAGLCMHGSTSAAVAMLYKTPEKDVITYNIVIQGLAEEGRMGEAMGVYRGAVEAGEEPGCGAYDALVRGNCQAGEPAAAAALMEEMVMRKVEPLSRSYDCVIRGFCDVGNVDEGLLWLGRAISAGNKPVEESFDRLIECLCGAGRVDDVLVVVRKMVEMRRRLGEATCWLLIETLCGRNSTLVCDYVNRILYDA
ncbi:uncharacterized protein LOC144711026 [Wolffia australiana]